MTLTIDLTPTEEAQLQQIATARGEDLAYFVANALRTEIEALAAGDTGNAEEQITGEQAAVARLIAAVKAGDKEAWLQLLQLTPPVANRTDLETGLPYPPISDEALRRESMYEDRS